MFCNPRTPVLTLAAEFILNFRLRAHAPFQGTKHTSYPVEQLVHCSITLTRLLLVWILLIQSALSQSGFAASLYRSPHVQ